MHSKESLQIATFYLTKSLMPTLPICVITKKLDYQVYAPV